MVLQLLAGILLACAIAAGVPTARLRVRRGTPLARFSLPDNATSIRENIATSFSCQARGYGYYADTENDCQLFHVCLPVVFDNDGSQQTFMWSFICPQDTMFNQERFTCARPEDSIPCTEAATFYRLNENFGERNPDHVTESSELLVTDNIIEEAR